MLKAKNLIDLVEMSEQLAQGTEQKHLVKKIVEELVALLDIKDAQEKAEDTKELIKFMEEQRDAARENYKAFKEDFHQGLQVAYVEMLAKIKGQ